MIKHIYLLTEGTVLIMVHTVSGSFQQGCTKLPNDPICASASADIIYTLPGKNIKVQCSAQKHDPLFAIVMCGASTTSSRTKKNALNTIV